MPFGERNLGTAKEIGIMNNKVLIAVSGEGILRRCSLMRKVLKAGNSCIFLCLYIIQSFLSLHPFYYLVNYMCHWVYVRSLADINFLLNQGNVSTKPFLKECIIKTIKWKHKVRPCQKTGCLHTVNILCTQLMSFVPRLIMHLYLYEHAEQFVPSSIHRMDIAVLV